jgi:hypothetical protein
VDIVPNFGTKRFTTKTDAIQFLRKFGFKKTNESDGCEVWEIARPKIVATMSPMTKKFYIVKQVTRIKYFQRSKKQ